MGERMMALPGAMGRSPPAPPCDATGQRLVFLRDSLRLFRECTQLA